MFLQLTYKDTSCLFQNFTLDFTFARKRLLQSALQGGIIAPVTTGQLCRVSEDFVNIQSSQPELMEQLQLVEKRFYG